MDKKIMMIICLTLKQKLPDAMIENENGMEIAEWIIRNLEKSGYEIIENDDIPVKINKEISKRIQEKYGVLEDDIMEFIIQELDKFEKKVKK